MNRNRGNCWYFSNGYCKYGEKCKFKHSSQYRNFRQDDDFQYNRKNWKYQQSYFNKPNQNTICIYNNRQIINEIQECIRDELIAWEKGNIWQFSSFGPFKYSYNFPGFEDVSAEELRWSAYQSNSVDSKFCLTTCISSLELKFQKNKLKLLNTDETVTHILFALYSGETIPEIEPSFELTTFLNKYIYKNISVSDEIPKNFSFHIDLESSNILQNKSKDLISCHSGKILLPFTNGSKDCNTAVTDMDIVESKTAGSQPKLISVKVYTPLSDLTTDEKEQFLSNSFILSKIPNRPPPKELC